MKGRETDKEEEKRKERGGMEKRTIKRKYTATISADKDTNSVTIRQCADASTKAQNCTDIHAKHPPPPPSVHV